MNPVPGICEGDSAGVWTRMTGWWMSPFPEAEANRRAHSHSLLLWLWPGRVGARSGAGTAELRQRGAGSELPQPAAEACGCAIAAHSLHAAFPPSTDWQLGGLTQFWAIFSKILNWNKAGFIAHSEMWEMVPAWAASEWHFPTPKLWVRQMALSKQKFYCRV